MNRRPAALRARAIAPGLVVILIATFAMPALGAIADYALTETVLGAFPATPAEARRILETQVAPDGRHIATLESVPVEGIKNLPDQIMATRGSFVRRDGVSGATWREIRRGSLAWSADSRRVMYMARRDSSWYVVVGDSAGPPFTLVTRAAFVGEHGDAIYSARRGDSSVVMFRGEELPACTGAHWWWVASSGGRVACVIPRGERWLLAVDGTPTAEWDHVPYFGFTQPDGAHYFYIAREAGRQRIVFDQTPGPVYDEVDKLRCRDTPGSCVAWVRIGVEWHVARGDSLGPGYRENQIWNKALLVSPDGRRVAYITSEKHGDKEDWTLHVDGSDYGPYDGFGTPVWGGDGARWAMVAGRGEKRFVVVDGVAGPEFGMVVAQGPFFSRDGAHLGYFVQEEKSMTLMLDGKAVVTLDKIIGPNLTFSDDGKHWAVAGKRGDAWHLVIDGELAENGYGDVRAPGPVFAKDGSISFVAKRGDEIVSATYAPKLGRVE